MGVPNTTTFDLQDVVDEINPTTDDLTDCFADAESTYFNTGWKTLYYEEAGNLNNLLMFRDYGIANSVVTISVSPDEVYLSAYDTEQADCEVFVNIGGWEITVSTSWVNTSVVGNVITVTADDNTGVARQGAVSLRSTTDTSKTASITVNQAGSSQSTFTINVNGSFYWQWDDLNVSKTLTYSPTASVTIAYAGDTGFWSVVETNGSIVITDILRNPWEGPRREMTITLSKTGYEDKVVTCVKYQQY